MAAVDLSLNLRDVTDGTSNTFLILELSRNAEHSWVSKNTGSNPFMWVHHPSQGMVTAGELSGSSPPFPPNTNFPNSRGAIGGHPGGLNVAFGDGHVQFIKNSINFQIYRALFSRGLGEITVVRRLLTRLTEPSRSGVASPGPAFASLPLRNPPPGREGRWDESTSLAEALR